MYVCTVRVFPFRHKYVITTSDLPLQVDLATALELIAAKRARDAARAAKGLLPRGGRRGKAAAGAGAAGKKGKEAKGGAGAGTGGGAGGYVEFARVRWAEMKAEDPDASYREAVKVISAEWRGMGEEQRRAFAAGGGGGAGAGGSESEGEGDGEQGLEVAAGGVEQVAAGVATKGRKKAAAVTVKKGAAAKVAVGAGAGAGAGKAGSKGSSSKGRSSSSGDGGGAGRVNPYLAFCREQRDAIRAAHPGADMVEQARLLGAAWRALSEEQRAAYQ